MTSPHSPGASIFVDESKSRDYLLVAAVVLPGDIASARSVVKALVKPRQPRIHMKSESDSRRRQILSQFTKAGFSATIYRSSGPRKDVDRRAKCLSELLTDATAAKCGFLCMESDHLQDRLDRQQIAATLKAGGHELRYDHRSAANELLLCVPDAIAWAYARGGNWSPLVAPLIREVKDL